MNISSGGTAFIRTETVYSENGNYVASTTNAQGSTVTQSVNTTDGTLTSVTDPNGQTVNYSYDASKRVTAVQTTANGKAYRNAYTYENDRIKTVKHNTTTDTEDVTYTFAYDALGRKTTVKVGTCQLSRNVYMSRRGALLSRVMYGNGGEIKYLYDSFDRMTGMWYDDETTRRYIYAYGANGQIGSVTDKHLGRVLQTEYDLADRPMGTQLRDTSGNLLYRTELDYDMQNRMVGFGEETADGTHKTDYTYDNDNRVTALTYDSENSVTYAYDELGRVSTRTAGSLTSTYGYAAGNHGENSTTPLVASIAQGSIPFTYAYDNRGNIISETRNGVTTSYSYDALGQLIRVDDPVQNQTWVFNYDRGGNITSRVRYAYTIGTVGTALETIPYTYGDSNWKDKLTAYNGKTITYDAIGNPTNDGTWSYEWQAGRQLAGMSRDGATLSFKYDHNALRTQKVVQTDWLPETTNYFLHGKLLTHMTVDYTDFDEVAHTDKLHFFYDAQSRPAQVNFNGVLYTYIHNLQGDIVGILDNSGALVVEYKYDAWGKLLSVTGNLADTLGKRNPFRYRGYVYDEETGLYYLRSRYYNPEIGRFINSDTLLGNVGALGSHNLFAYCKSNPLMRTDPLGSESVAVTGTQFPDFGTILRAILVRAKQALLKSAIFNSIYHEAKRQWDSSIHVATGETDTPEQDVNRDGTYYFAHITDDGSLRVYLSPEFTLDNIAAVSTYEAWRYYSGIVGYKYIGFYTKTREDAEKLAVLWGGSISRPDNHSNSVGVMYLHFHDDDHVFHIWYGSPIF